MDTTIPDIAETFCTGAIIAPVPPPPAPPPPRQNVQPNLAMVPHHVQADDLVPNGDKWLRWSDYDVLCRREITWLREQVAEKDRRLADQEAMIDDLKARLRGADAAAEATTEVMRGLTERLADVLHHTHAITGT